MNSVVQFKRTSQIIHGDFVCRGTDISIDCKLSPPKFKPHSFPLRVTSKNSTPDRNLYPPPLPLTFISIRKQNIEHKKIDTESISLIVGNKKINPLMDSLLNDKLNKRTSSAERSIVFKRHWKHLRERNLCMKIRWISYEIHKGKQKHDA